MHILSLTTTQLQMPASRAPRASRCPAGFSHLSRLPGVSVSFVYIYILKMLVPFKVALNMEQWLLPQASPPGPACPALQCGGSGQAQGHEWSFHN